MKHKIVRIVHLNALVTMKKEIVKLQSTIISIVRKKKVRELLLSPEGIYHQKRRAIEPESVFGQSKFNKQYTRFRHFGKEMIITNLTIFAIAFNLGKMYNKWRTMPKNGPNGSKNANKWVVLLRITVFVTLLEATRKITRPHVKKMKIAA